MPVLTDLKEDLDDLYTTKFISSALTEAAAGRLYKIRDSFVRNTQIYQEISNLYHLVRKSYFKMKADEKIKPPAIDLKILSVAVTSNQHFYGNINNNIMRQFVERTRGEKTDLLVIGSTGQAYMKISSFGRRYESLTFHKDIPAVEESNVFIDKTQNYDQIFFYFPKFISLVNQTVGLVDITQAAQPEGGADAEIKVLYEPELPKILDFFNKTVRRLLFIRITLETDLSLTAARLLAMSAAEERSTDLIKEKMSEIRKAVSSSINAQLLETFSSISTWKEEE